MSDTQHILPHAASTNEGNSTGLSSTVDIHALWLELRAEAQRVAAEETSIKHLLEDVVISRDSLAAAIGARLARRLGREEVPRSRLEPLLIHILSESPVIVQRAACDLIAIPERDPACFSILEPLLFFKGFLALTTYRIAHQLWLDNRRWLALYLQSVVSEAFAVDIHPAARIGSGILLDHATSFVVGETAIIEDNVSILHEVTLGGTGKQTGNRHPIVRSGVLIGAGAKILGRVEIGQGAKIGAGSVVLNDIPAHKTAAGVPAVVVGQAKEENPAIEMDQSLECDGAYFRDGQGI